MPQGIVKFFLEDRGYGFITADDGADIYANGRDIQGTGYRTLVCGEPVEFEIGTQSDGRLKAVNIRPPSYRLRGTVESFSSRKGTGRIAPADPSIPSIFFHHSQILSNTSTRRTAIEEELVEFEEGLGPKGAGDRQALRVKRIDSRLPLYRFADMGPDEKWLEKLAGAADKEDWEYAGTPPGSETYPILKSYLIYTYSRVADESDDQPDPLKRKVQIATHEGKRMACFNTGLVTKRHQPIYAKFYGKNPGQDGRSWRFSSFCTDRDGELLEAFKALPEPAHYFENPGDLIYDRHRELMMDYDHIPDRADRLPPAIRGMLTDSNIRFYLDPAKEKAVARVKQNFKTAIPCYYQKRVQLLLPLFLSNEHHADAALAVTRVGEHYLAKTVLTLDWAYKMARLLARPDREWLDPAPPDSDNGSPALAESDEAQENAGLTVPGDA